MPADKLWSIDDYPLATYPFPALVGRSLQVDELNALRSDDPRWTRESDQASRWHRSFYAGFEQWRPLYDQFIREQVAPRIGEPVYYQAVPTFRVHQPGNVAVGDFHTDAQYHHPAGEITFWLPLTAAFGTNSVWVEDDDRQLHPFVARPGQVVTFSAVSRRHGNLVNTTGRARVSFDFRCLPVRLLPGGPAGRSVNAGLRFVPGEYYRAEPVVAG
ncbi:hypothetical protein ACFY3U_26425 [Micromonospora sp. NPDC000089]|uniref:hypothetical protein n=1 Tax=unclassified Micromonospora TaxID=2617518 RepID=UPI0036AB2F6D